MHSLDVIIRRNAEAAGREAAHAYNDKDNARVERILAAYDDEQSYEHSIHLGRAYTRARQEG